MPAACVAAGTGGGTFGHALPPPWRRVHGLGWDGRCRAGSLWRIGEPDGKRRRATIRSHVTQ